MPGERVRTYRRAVSALTTARSTPGLTRLVPLDVEMSRRVRAIHCVQMPWRALTDDEIDALLRSERIVRMAFAEGEPYVVPLGYVWVESALWGTTRRGRKTRMAEGQPRIAFTVDDSSQAVPFAWRCVVGAGHSVSATRTSIRASSRRRPCSRGSTRASDTESPSSANWPRRRRTPVRHQTSDEDDGYSYGSEGCAGDHAGHLSRRHRPTHLRGHAIRLRRVLARRPHAGIPLATG
jgi:nitroimidazol reductase NimA-like FMN-containing flavoprotein (pyridoxamine 5'-phosphate oxidase superfamily)